MTEIVIAAAARTLSGANVPTRRLNRCLQELRKALPADVPLSGLSITAIGDQIAVREGDHGVDDPDVTRHGHSAIPPQDR